MTFNAALVTIIVLGVCAYFGFLRPTGLAGRTRADEEEERQRELATKWLNKDSGGDGN